MSFMTPMVMPRLKGVLLPEVREIPAKVKKLISEGKYNPGDVDLLPENCGYWVDEFRKNRTLFEFGWPTAMYSRKVSPYNRLDERFLIAEIYFDGESHNITACFQNKKNKERIQKFRIKGQINERKLKKLFNMIESKYKDVLETKQESDELRETFGFDKFIDDIVLREEKLKEEKKLLAKAEEESIGRKISNMRRTDVYSKIKIK